MQNQLQKFFQNSKDCYDEATVIDNNQFSRIDFSIH